MCGDPLASSVSVALRVQLLGPTSQRAVSFPVQSSVDQTWSWGQIRCQRRIPLEIPLLSTVITSPFIFTWIPLGTFLRLFQCMSISHFGGFSLLSGSFIAYFPPHLLYHNILSEPAATIFQKTYLA